MNRNTLKIVCIALSFQGNLLMAMDAGAPGGAKYPLHTAVVQGHTEIVRLLVQQNSPVNLPDDTGQFPLQLALKKPHSGKRTAIVVALIEAGADIDELNAKKEPLLFYVIRKVDVPAVQLLLSYGANLSATDLEGRTPLQYAQEKVQKSDNKKTESVFALVQEYFNGRVPEYRARILSKAQRSQLIADSHRSVLKALATTRKELEEKIALRERENYFLQIDLRALELQKEIQELKASL